MRARWLTVLLIAVWFGNALSNCDTGCNVPLSSDSHNKFSGRLNSKFNAFNRTRDVVEHVFHGEVSTAYEDKDELEDGVVEETRGGVDVDWITQVSSVLSPLPDDLTHGCRKDTDTYLRELRNFTDWAVRMMDASAKFPHGILMGNIRALGDFDECLWLEAPAGIKPQYCLANINLNDPKRHTSYSNLRGVIRTMSYNRVDKELPASTLGNLALQKSARIEWAMCMPASCTPSDLERVFNGATKRISPHFDVRVTVDSMDCYTDGPKSSFSARDRMILSAMLVVLLLVFTGTLYDMPDPNNNVIEEKSILSKVLKAFSLRRSWNELTEYSTIRSGQIDCLDGMRAISAVWIVIGHQGFLATNNPYSDKVTNFNTHKYSLMYPLWNFFLAVDTFLVIGGLVRCYTLIANLERHTANHWKNALLRYLRLTPALLAVIGFYIAFMDRVASGPNWNRHVGANKIACELHWWKTVLYINNYFNSDHNMCILQSWYTSMDMQYFLLSPLIIVPLWRRPSTGFALLGGVAAVATIVQYTTIITNEMTGIPVGFQTSDTELLNHLFRYYFITHMRSVPYLIGIMMGYFMYYNKRVNLSKIQLATGWTLSVMAFVWPLVGAKLIVSAGNNFDHVEHAVFGAMHKSAWAMSMAWLIFACHLGYGGLINKILSCNFFKFLSRMSYSIFVTHLGVLVCFSGYLRVPKHTDVPSVSRDIIGETILVLVPALILHLVVESPFTALSQLIFRKSTRMTKKVQ